MRKNYWQYMARKGVDAGRFEAERTSGDELFPSIFGGFFRPFDAPLMGRLPDDSPMGARFNEAGGLGPFFLNGSVVDFDFSAIAEPAPAAETSVPTDQDVAEPRDDAAEAPTQRSAIAFVGATGQIGAAVPGLTATGRELDLIILFSEDLQSSLVVDAATRQLLPGGAGDYADIGRGRDDVLSLSGDFSGGGTTLPNLPGLDLVHLRGGTSYTLLAGDGIAPGGSLTVGGAGLGAGDSINFDGSGETDGSFVFHGGGGQDVFIGGAGADLIYGLGGADTLTGGAGADIFAYTHASESSSAGYDFITDFDPGEDRIDLPVTVTGFAGAVEGGSLSSATFDDDLATALGAFGPGQAILFAPDEGDLAGRVFLVVDANGEEGYQAGEDFVFAIGGGATLADLGGSTDIFI